MKKLSKAQQQILDLLKKGTPMVAGDIYMFPRRLFVGSGSLGKYMDRRSVLELVKRGVAVEIAYGKLGKSYKLADN